MPAGDRRGAVDSLISFIVMRGPAILGFSKKIETEIIKKYSPQIQIFHSSSILFELYSKSPSICHIELNTLYVVALLG